MLKLILTGSFMIVFIMFIFLAALTGFYFGYETAGGYCKDVLSDCATKLKESSGIANLIYQEDYEQNLIKEYENMANWSINISNIIK